MEHEIFQNGQPVLTNDLLKAQSSLENAITSRFTDSFSQGILQGTLGQFAITINVGNPSLIDIATGVGYDTLGNRIAINSAADIYQAPYVVGSVQTSGNPLAAQPRLSNGPLTTTNNGVGGYTLTPQNSGCKGIPLFSEYNYIWLGYVTTIDPSIFVLQNLTNLRLFTSANDGYQIVVVGSPTIVTPSTLNPDQVNFSYIYLGYVNNTGAPSPLAPGNINTTDRVFYSLENNRLFAQVPLADIDRTPAYTYGQSIDLQDHVGAIGNGIVSPTNPHGMELSDLSNVGTTVSEHEATMHSSGITGTNTSSLSSSINAGDIAGNPAWGVNALVIAPLLGGQTLEIFGVTMDSATALGFTTEFYMASSGGTILPSDTYIVYVDSLSLSMKLAAIGPGIGASYQVAVNAILSSASAVAAGSLSDTDFILYSFSFNNGTGVISSVVDQRLFGNIDTTNLSHDSATNTFDINHNVVITGTLNVSGTFTTPVINATSQIQQQGFQLIPPGTLSAFAGSIPPGGWLTCDGSSYTIASHTALFSAIGYGWGGSGANFNVPDLRGVFLRGANNMGTGDAVDSFADPDKTTRVTRLSGGETGDNIGSFQLDTLLNHRHQNGGNIVANGGDVGYVAPQTSTIFDTTPTAGFMETRSKNAYVMYMIKY